MTILRVNWCYGRPMRTGILRESLSWGSYTCYECRLGTKMGWMSVVSTWTWVPPYISQHVYLICLIPVPVLANTCKSLSSSSPNSSWRFPQIVHIQVEASDKQNAVSASWVRSRVESGLGEGAYYLVQGQRERDWSGYTILILSLWIHLSWYSSNFLYMTLKYLCILLRNCYIWHFKLNISMSFSSGLEADGIPLLENVSPLLSPWLAFLSHSIVILHWPKDIYWWVEIGRKLQRASLMIQLWSNLAAV